MVDTMLGAQSFYRIKTRIQAANVDDNADGSPSDLSVTGLLARIFKEEGVAGYYRGFGATMLNTFSMRASSHLSLARTHP